MNNILDLIDSISSWFESLREAIEGNNNMILENRIDSFWNMTMHKCQICFWKDSELYKEAQKIYGEVLLWINTKDYKKISWTLGLIESFLSKIESERDKEIEK